MSLPEPISLASPPTSAPASLPTAPSAAPSTAPSTNNATCWAQLLADLEQRTSAGSPGSALPIAWTIHTWATEQFDSAAIRIESSEGLIGRAPAQWRLLCHAFDGRAYAIAVLDGRAPLRPDNVLASLLVAPERPPVITVRDDDDNSGGSDTAAIVRKLGQDRQGITTPAAALAGLVDLALGRVTRVSGSASCLPPALRLAAALAMEQRGHALVWTSPNRRDSRRVRAFVGTRDPAVASRQLSAVEAVLRKRDRMERLRPKGPA